MNLLYRGLLALIALVGLIVVAGPVLAIALLFAALVGLFSLAVSLWAVVLMGEQWITGTNVRGLNYGDALDDSLHDVANGIRLAIRALRPSTIKARVVAALPLLRERSIVLAGIVGLPIMFFADAFGRGFPFAVRELSYAVRSTIPAMWRGDYF